MKGDPKVLDLLNEALKAKEEAERVLSHKDPKMSVEEAQAQLAMSIAQLSALERLRKNLKH